MKMRAAVTRGVSAPRLREAIEDLFVLALRLRERAERRGRLGGDHCAKLLQRRVRLAETIELLRHDETRGRLSHGRFRDATTARGVEERAP